MFPTLDLNDLVESINSESSSDTVEESIGKVFMLEFTSDNKARVKLEDGKPVLAKTIKEKLQMYIQVLLRTELGKYKIYEDTEFGTTYFKYRGKNLPSGFVKSELKREITENLSNISAFDSIENFETTLSNASLSVSFDLMLKDSDSISISI